MSEVSHGGYYLQKVIFIIITKLEYHTSDIKKSYLLIISYYCLMYKYKIVSLLLIIVTIGIHY